MSVFRKFKLPQLLRKGPPASETGEDIPRFKCSELPLKQRLGQGSFGDVYTAEYLLRQGLVFNSPTLTSFDGKSTMTSEE